VLRMTTIFGADEGSIQLVPLGNHVFAYGLYANGRLSRVYWSEDRIEFHFENNRVVGFDDRSATGAVYAKGRRVE
jgi:hypothetical protein